MNDVAGQSERAQRNADRLLTAIYIMSDGYAGVSIARSRIATFVAVHRLFSMSEDEWALWAKEYFVPVFERAQARKPQA